MKNLSIPKLWLICGSQHLYDTEVLATVASNASADCGWAKQQPENLFCEAGKM